MNERVGAVACLMLMGCVTPEPATDVTLAPDRPGARLQDRFWPVPDGAWHPRHRYDAAAPRYWPPDEYTTTQTDAQLQFPPQFHTMEFTTDD